VFLKRYIFGTEWSYYKCGMVLMQIGIFLDITQYPELTFHLMTRPI